MPHKRRHDEYLKTYHFYHNSIDFRIVSSKALEKYKNVQSFQLNQLVNGKFYFPQEVREILLLKFDMWSRWLTEVENFFVERNGHSSEISEEDINTLINLASKTATKYTDIITTEETKKYFDQDFSSIWLESHNHAYEFFIQDLQKLSGGYHSAYVKIVDILCEILRYTLTELHEINEMMKDPETESAFMVISDYCIRFYKETGSCLIAKRCETYRKYFKFNTLWFKNYTNSNLPAELIENVEKNGVKVDYKRCLFN